ncbi:GGDEF domain-containing protein [Pseudoalteromonas sp. MMG010]|uniref:tetratricopeptide repeat-containing diguanylate cyclase n=1 Tax=Pseudoalteromonas sp. MMG010 TaxID=2822685 RepID=UPI001B39FC19|nr:GGDEF domain-containing protein [Pseudoalteromonas sp. MMG010]
MKAHSTEGVSWIDRKVEHAERLSENDPNLAIQFIKQILKQQPVELTALGAAELNIHLLENYIYISHLNAALALVEEIDKAYLGLKPPTQVSYLSLKATLYSYLGNFELAEPLIIEAELKAKEINDLTLLGEIYHIKGEFYGGINDDIKAIEAYSNAYELMSITNDKLNLAYLEGSMAQAYASLYDFDKAVSLITNSLVYFDEHNLHFDRSTAHYNLAQFYLHLDKPAQALHHATAMLSIIDKLSNPTLKYFSYILSARAYFELGQLDKARKDLDLSSSFISDVEGARNTLNYLFTKAKVEMGENKLDLALITLNQAQEKLNTLPDGKIVMMRLDLSSLFSSLYAAKKNFEKAYQYKLKHLEMNELYNSNVREAVRSRYKVAFDLKQVDLKNQLLEKDKALNNFALIEAQQQKAIQRVIIISILIIFVAVSIFSIRQYQLKLRFSRLANTDALTGVANRRKIMNVVEQTCSQNTANTFSLISFDLDHFKQVNDNYGHPAGDKVLKAVSKITQDIISDECELGRIGGEEFLIVLNNKNLSESVEIAQKIKSAIENLIIKSDEYKIKITASFGVVQKHNMLTSYKELIKYADNALYIAKDKGRNRIQTYE